MRDTHPDAPSFWDSRRNQRMVLWGGLAILATGVAVATFVFLGNTGTTFADTRSTVPADIFEPKPQAKVDAAARRVAGRWILTSVARKDLGTGYALTHPELRQGLTRAQWLTGTIPVQPYPADQLDAATFRVMESYPDEVYLEVALLPKAGIDIKPQIFQIGLKRIGGVKGPWRVSYWLPRGRPELPTNRE
jgi:hypothetical protein